MPARRCSAGRGTRVPGPLLTDAAGQKGGAEAGIDRADLRADLTEDRLFRGDGEIADGDEDIAATDGIALHARDHRLRHVPDQALDLVDRQANRSAAAIAACMA